MKLIQKKIVYRSASITNCESSLQQLLEKALKITQVNGRQQELNEYERTFRTINRKWSYRGIVICEMVLIDPGASQPLAVYDESKGLYTIDAISTKELTQEKLKKNSDFVNSILYFGVKGNEVVVMPSQAINVRALENYLAWFLGDRLSLISDKSNFFLSKNIPRGVERQIISSPVKSIEIGSAIYNADDVSDKFVSSESCSVNPKLLLRALGGVLKDNVLSSISDESNIRAKIVISYFRRTDDAGRRFMSRLSTALRNVDDADVCVTLKNNMKIYGKELSLQKFVKIGRTDRGLLVNDDISEAMVSWLLELNEQRETS